MKILDSIRNKVADALSPLHNYVGGFKDGYNSDPWQESLRRVVDGFEYGAMYQPYQKAQGIGQVVGGVLATAAIVGYFGFGAASLIAAAAASPVAVGGVLAVKLAELALLALPSTVTIGLAGVLAGRWVTPALAALGGTGFNLLKMPFTQPAADTAPALAAGLAPEAPSAFRDIGSLSAGFNPSALRPSQDTTPQSAPAMTAKLKPS